MIHLYIFFFFSSRRRHTRYWRDWSSDVCSSDLPEAAHVGLVPDLPVRDARLVVADGRGGEVLPGGEIAGRALVGAGATGRPRPCRRVGQKAQDVEAAGSNGGHDAVVGAPAPLVVLRLDRRPEEVEADPRRTRALDGVEQAAERGVVEAEQA